MKLMKPNFSNFSETIERSLENTLNFENSSIFSKYNEVDNISILNLYYIENPILDTIIPYLKEKGEIKLFNSDQEYIYRNRPMKLSYDIYGVIDYWYILLAVNDYINPYEFKNFKKLIIPDKSIIEETINKIIYKNKNIGINSLE